MLKYSQIYKKIHGWAIIGAEASDTDMVFGSVMSHIRLTLTLHLLINLKDSNSKILQLRNLCPGKHGYQELSVIYSSKETISNSTPHCVLLTNLLSTLTLQLRDLCLGNKDTNSLVIQCALVQMCISQDKLTYTSKALWEARRPSKDEYMRILASWHSQ